MTTYEQKVKDICDEVYIKFPAQILIDFVQEEVEELLNKMNENCRNITPGRDEVGALAYECGNMLEVYNPKLERDIDILTRLQEALNEWANDIEATNVILGIPRET